MIVGMAVDTMVPSIAVMKVAMKTATVTRVTLVFLTVPFADICILDSDGWTRFAPLMKLPADYNHHIGPVTGGTLCYHIARSRSSVG